MHIKHSRLKIFVVVIVVLGVILFRNGKNILLNISPEGLQGSVCLFPLCDLTQFEQDAYINSISIQQYLREPQASALARQDIATASNLSMAISYPYYEDAITATTLARRSDKITGKGERLGHLLATRGFGLDNRDDIEYSYNGEPISFDQFLKISFGAKAVVSGYYQSQFTGSNHETRSKLIKIDVKQTLKEWVDFSDYATYGNNSFQFKYHPDWEISQSGEDFVQLKKTNLSESDAENIKYAGDMSLTMKLISNSQYEKEIEEVGNIQDGWFGKVVWGNRDLLYFDPPGGESYWFRVDKDQVFKITTGYSEHVVPFSIDAKNGMVYSLLSSLNFED